LKTNAFSGHARLLRPAILIRVHRKGKIPDRRVEKAFAGGMDCSMLVKF
jgi:hypothetical protein